MSSAEFGPLIVGIDIETTGVYQGNDLIILGSIVAIDPVTMRIVTREIFEPNENMFGRRIPKPSDGETYEDVWVKCGFEKRCYQDFWSKNLELLEKIQRDYDNIVSDDDASLASRVNSILQKIEEASSESLTIVSDTMAYDTVFVSGLLITHGYKPLYYSRGGRYRWIYHTSSYFLGIWGGNIAGMDRDDWRDYDDWLKNVVGVMDGCPTDHDHNPENDAITIAWGFIKVCNYAKRQKH